MNRWSQKLRTKWSMNAAKYKKNTNDKIWANWNKILADIGLNPRYDILN